VRFLDALKATGIVMVVAVHVLSRLDLSGLDRDLITYLVGAIAVPLFFVVDGYVFSWKFTNAPQFDYRSYIGKSALRLLVPWTAFSILYGAIRIVLEWLELTREAVLLGNDFVGTVKVVYLSDISPHMYFLLSLFLVRLGSIVFCRTLRWPFGVWLTVSFAYIGIYQLSQPKEWFLPGADPVLLACWGAQFYFLGVALQKGLSRIRLYATPLLLLCIGAAIASKFMAPAGLQYISQVFYLTAAGIIILLITDRTSWSFSLGQDSMGIYLLHAPLIVWGASAMVTTFLAPTSIMAFAVATCVSVLFSWLGSRLMSRSSGGRLLLGQSMTFEKRC
jgi:peptidoglycan/LPS O-acetylase OafA/YrhL